MSKPAPSGDYGWGAFYPPEKRVCAACHAKLTLKGALWFDGMNRLVYHWDHRPTVKVR